MKEKYVWVDRVKLLACLLVVLGHFLSGLILADIIENNIFLEWFSKTIYYFHVPLFFICSGYLYQNSSKVTNFKEWKKNVSKKLMALGIPYVIFSTVTVLMKTIASDSVNSKASGLVHTILFEPIAPYWFIYVLFFMFFFTKTFEKKSDMYKMTAIALTVKIIMIFFRGNRVYSDIPYFIRGIAMHEIWFIVGMNYRYLYEPKTLIMKLQNIKKYMGIFIFATIISILIIIFDINSEILYFVEGILFCFSIVNTMIFLSKYRMIDFEKFLSKYTMSIFLMHTIFAAGIRIFLIKIGIMNAVIHLLVGFCASVFLPIISEIIMRKNKILYFLIYPNQVLKRKEE